MPSQDAIFSQEGNTEKEMNVGSQTVMSQVSSVLCFFFNNFISYFSGVFFFGCVRSLLLWGLFSSCGKLELLSGSGVQAAHRNGFSRRRAGALGTMGSIVAAPRL